jgi:hypothetical protein
MASNDNADKSTQPPSVPPTAPLASQSPELWEPVSEWGGDELTEPIPDALDAATLSEGGQEQPRETAGEETQKIHVGDTAWSAIRRIPLFIRLVIVVVILGASAYGYGLWQRRQLPALLRKVRLGQQPTLTLVDACKDRVLIWEVVGNRNEILIQTSPQGGWVRVSREDTTATSPALSPDAERVVYLSLLDSGQVVVVPLDTTATQTIISVSQLESAAVASEYSGMTFCNWTSLAWDPDGHRLAFFGCRKEKPRSIAFVAHIDRGPVKLELIPGSEADNPDPRQLQWSGSKHVVLSWSTLTGEQIRTLPVP